MIAAITFLDHVEDDTKPMRATVYGVVESSDNDCIVINSWVGGDADGHNNKRFCIIRSCVISITELREKKHR